jgi:hypothetical protein
MDKLMALDGSIKDFGLAEIFQLIFMQRKTGLLRLTSKERSATILFENGLIVDASSSERGSIEKIGEILIRANRLNEQQLQEVLKNQEVAKEKLGRLLSESGLIKSEDVKKALNLQMHEVIFSLFRWKEGDYHFEQKDVHYDPDYPPLNTEFILMEGIRRLDEWPFLEKIIPSRRLLLQRVEGKETSISLRSTEADEELDILQEVKRNESGDYILNPQEYDIYKIIDGKRDVQTLLKMSHLDDFETYTVLSNLITAGLVEKIGESKTFPNLSRTPFFSQRVIMGLNTVLVNLLIFGLIIMFIIIGVYSITSKQELKQELISRLAGGSESGSLPAAGLPGRQGEADIRDQGLYRIINMNHKNVLDRAVELFYLRYKRYPVDLKEMMEQFHFFIPFSIDGFDYKVTERGYMLE